MQLMLNMIKTGYVDIFYKVIYFEGNVCNL